MDTRIENKLDVIKEDISNIKQILVRQQVILEEHIARTEASEDRIEIVEETLAPVRDHVLLVNFAVKIVAAVGAVVGTVIGILSFIVK